MSGGASRRGFLVLCVGGVTALSLTGSAGLAQAATVTVDGLEFDVPADVRPTSVGDPSWQWRGGRDTQSGAALLVLARADLPSTDGEEVVGLLLAGGLAGELPGLVVEGRRRRPMPGGGEQLRLDLAYDASTSTRYHGTVLVATRDRSPAAVLAVLGDDALTAGETSFVLDSARWAS